MTASRPATSGTFVERAMREVARTAAEADGSVVVDPTRVKLLDAAYEQFCETGIAGTSMDEVARRAGTARITIYRKFENKDALVDAVMMREFGRYIEAFQDEITRADNVTDRVTSTFVTSLLTIGGNPLITRLLETEPAMLPALVGGGDGRTMGEVRDFVAMQIGQEQAAGNIPQSVSTALAAEIVVRLCVSLLTTPSEQIDLADAEALTALAGEFVLPILGLHAR